MQNRRRDKDLKGKVLNIITLFKSVSENAAKPLCFFCAFCVEVSSGSSASLVLFFCTPWPLGFLCFTTALLWDLQF